MAERKSTWARFWAAASHPTRDGILFVIGVVGILWETIGEESDRPYLLAVFAACCGLPVFLNLDERMPHKESEHEP